MKDRQKGVTLVELMISMAIGLSLSVGLVQFASSITRFSTNLDSSGALLDNAQYAMGLLREQIHLAGYYGKYSINFTIPAALVDPCSNNIATITSGLAFPIQGYDDPIISPIISCLPIANHVSGTDILVIRRLSTAVTAVANLVDQDAYMQSTSTGFVLGQATGVLATDQATFNLLQKDGANLEEIRKAYVSIYFISPCYDMGASPTCSSTSDNGSPIPTLKRLDLGVSGGIRVMVLTPIAVGMQNLQLEYGIDRSDDGAPNESAVGANDAYVEQPADTTDWSNVVSVQVYTLVRSEFKSEYEDKKVYTLGLSGNVGPFNDEYRRHMFTSNYRVINVSLRRAAS